MHGICCHLLCAVTGEEGGTVHGLYGDVPLDGYGFYFSVLNRVYNLCESVLIRKSKKYNVNLLCCNHDC